MNKRNQPRRQIYNRQQLNKQALKNRQITGLRRQKKINIAQDIVNEIEKEENGVEMTEEEKKEKAGEEENAQKNENQEEKEQKKKQERLKLDAKTLLYNTDNGLRKFYEVITKTEFNNKDNTKNLDKLINLTRNWHFMLFPNYDFEYFTNKLISLGKQAPTKSYMSRVRRIYKGEEKWDIIYDEQAQILGKTSIMNEKKEFVNPNPENNNNENNNKKENNDISNNKKDDFNFNAEEQGIIQDLFLKDEIMEENDKKEKENIKKENDKEKTEKKDDINDDFEIKDSDFDNFPEDYNPEEEYEKKKLVSNLKNPSLHESLLNSHENKLKNMNFGTGSKQSMFSGIDIDENLRPQIREFSNLKEKRTSDQIFGNIDKNENVENIKPELMKNKMVIE